MNQTHGQCIFERVFDDLDFIIASTGQVQTNLRLYSRSRNVFIDSVLNGRLSLMFYKCETKANDCGQCLSLNKQFSCMWCNHKGPGDGQSSQSKVKIDYLLNNFVIKRLKLFIKITEKFIF